MTSAPDTATVPLDAPLDLRDTLAPLSLGPRDPTLRLQAGTAHWALHTPDGPTALAMEVHDSTLHGAAWGPGAPWALCHLADLSGAWDAPTSPLEDHPRLRELVRRTPGLRLARTHRVVDALVGAILQQLVAWEDAARAFARLVHAHGEPAPGPLDLRLPLLPRALVALPRDRYLAAGVLGRQADTIRRVATVAPRMEEAATMPLPDALRRLEAVPGVGPWTSGIVAIRALGHADAVPLRDLHIPHNVGWLLAHEPHADDTRMLELLAPFAPHRGRLIRLMQAAGAGAPRRSPRAPLRRPR